jgi:hypothetical protein
VGVAWLAGRSLLVKQRFPYVFTLSVIYVTVTQKESISVSEKQSKSTFSFLILSIPQVTTHTLFDQFWLIFIKPFWLCFVCTKGHFITDITDLFVFCSLTDFVETQLTTHLLMGYLHCYVYILFTLIHFTCKSKFTLTHIFECGQF